MEIPKNIKIGGFNYYVERPDGAFVSDGVALDGEHNRCGYIYPQPHAFTNDYEAGFLQNLTCKLVCRQGG